MTNMKRIVITGPTGAIGIAIIEQMIKRGIEVLAICNPLSKRSYRLPESSLIKIIRCDLNDLNKLNLKNNQPYDVFYHLGWKGTVGEAVSYTHLSYEMGNFAVDHGMTINYFPVARLDFEKIALNDNQYIEDLINGNDGEKNMYILDTDNRAKELGLTLYIVDGYRVGILQ